MFFPVVFSFLSASSTCSQKKRFLFLTHFYAFNVSVVALYINIVTLEDIHSLIIPPLNEKFSLLLKHFHLILLAGENLYLLGKHQIKYGFKLVAQMAIFVFSAHMWHLKNLFRRSAFFWT